MIFANQKSISYELPLRGLLSYCWDFLLYKVLLCLSCEINYLHFFWEHKVLNSFTNSTNTLRIRVHVT